MPDGQYSFPVEEDAVPLSSPMDALFGDVVYRSGGKDLMEVKLAIRKACEHFIRATGVWKRRFAAEPLAERPGWWQTVSAAEGIVVSIDSVEGMDSGMLPQMFPPGVSGATGFGPQVAVQRVGQNLREGNIRFDVTEARRVVFATSSTLLRTGITELGMMCGTPFSAYAPNTGSSGHTPQPPTMHPQGMHGALPARVFAVATMAMRFGSNHFPSWIVERWGDALADGASHILAAWPNAQASTAWGAAYNAAIEDVIGRISMGGMFSNGTGSAISDDVPRL